jgi:hypothetical protein
MAGELAHFVHLGAVADGVVNGCLAQRVDTDAAAPQPVGLDAGGQAVFLDQSPRRLPVQVAALKGEAARRQRPEGYQTVQLGSSNCRRGEK